MGLYLPEDGYANWGDELRYDLDRIDKHDHTSGKGVQLTPTATNGLWQYHAAPDLGSTAVAGLVAPTTIFEGYETGVLVANTGPLEIRWGAPAGANHVVKGPILSFRNKEVITSSERYAATIITGGRDTTSEALTNNLTPQTYTYDRGDFWLTVERAYGKTANEGTLDAYRLNSTSTIGLSKVAFRFRSYGIAPVGATSIVDDQMPAVMQIDEWGRLSILGDLLVGSQQSHFGLTWQGGLFGSNSVTTLYVWENWNGGAANTLAGEIRFTANQARLNSTFAATDDIAVSYAKNMSTLAGSLGTTGLTAKRGIMFRRSTDGTGNSWENLLGLDAEGNLWLRKNARIRGDLHVEGSINLTTTGTTTGQYQVKIYGNDAAGDYLGNKLQAGTNVNFDTSTFPGKLVINCTVQDNSGNVQVDNFSVKLNGNDSSPGFLQTKLVAGSNITFDTTTTPGTIIVNASTPPPSGGGGGVDNYTVKASADDPIPGYMWDKNGPFGKVRVDTPLIAEIMSDNLTDNYKYLHIRMPRVSAGQSQWEPFFGSVGIVKYQTWQHPTHLTLAKGSSSNPMLFQRDYSVFSQIQFSSGLLGSEHPVPNDLWLEHWTTGGIHALDSERGKWNLKGTALGVSSTLGRSQAQSRPITYPNWAVDTYGNTAQHGSLRVGGAIIAGSPGGVLAINATATRYYHYDSNTGHYWRLIKDGNNDAKWEAVGTNPPPIAEN